MACSIFNSNYLAQCGPNTGQRIEFLRPASFLSIDLMLCVTEAHFN